MTAGRQELIGRLKGGDADVFTALVERYQPLVYRWSIGLVLDRDEADDVMQEAFVLAYRKLGSFRGDGSIEGWLYRITRRVAAKHRGKKNRRTFLGALPAPVRRARFT